MYRLQQTLRVLCILLISITAQAQDNIPSFYSDIEADNENYLFSYANGESVEEALVIAFAQMAMKLDVKVQAMQRMFEESSEDSNSDDGGFMSTVVSTTRQITSRQFGAITVKGMQDMIVTEVNSDYVTTYVSATDFLFKPSEDEALMWKLYTKDVENSDGPLEEPVTKLDKAEKGVNWESLISYIENDPNMKVTYSSVKSDEERVYMKLSCSATYFKEIMDAELKEFMESSTFKKSEAYKKLEALMDSTGNK